MPAARRKNAKRLKQQADAEMSMTPTARKRREERAAVRAFQVRVVGHELQPHQKLLFQHERKAKW